MNVCMPENKTAQLNGTRLIEIFVKSISLAGKTSIDRFLR